MFWNSVKAEQPAEKTRKRLDTVELGNAPIFEAAALNILNQGLGFRASAEKNASMLGDQRVIPMMSYGFTEYMMGLDLSGLDLLELGGGSSTEFWSLRVKSVLTMETDPEWAKILISRMFDNTTIRTSPCETIWADMERIGRAFDAIIIDVSASRYKCARAALKILNPGGFVVLDNADWYPNTAALLRNGDLIQVDFADFRPLRWYRCTTSLFLHRDFRALPRHGRLPLTPIGGKDIARDNDWDEITD